jgi:ABC-2 type transport system ATP-binding protein
VALGGILFFRQSEVMTQPPIAELSLARKCYGALCALQNVSLSVQPGEVVAVLGPNGAGKTTAIRLLLGLTEPTTGSAKLFGLPPHHRAARQRTGVMLQTGGVPATLRVREHIELFSAYYPRPLPVAETIELAGLTGLEHRPYGQLSGGQQQRLLFALALCGRPDLLFLDEPTTGLDPQSRRTLWARIRSLAAGGAAVLLTTHYLEEAAALATRILLLRQGQVVAEGSPAELQAQAGAATLEEAFFTITETRAEEAWV